MYNNEIITTKIKELLSHLNIVVSDIRCETEEKTGSTRFIVDTPESAILIGEHGARLSALNHVIKKIVEQSTKEERLNFHIDVNDYHKKQLDDLRSKAHILAERARYFKSSVEMDPMSAYERMIVHAEFTDTPDIVTESAGYGKNRHVVIKYTETKTPSL